MTDLNFIDIHAHLNFPDFDADREAVIARLKKNRIGVINVGTSLKTSRQVVDLAKQYDNFWAIVGIHPHEAGRNFDLADLAELAGRPKVVAIGECGLDYFKVTDEAVKKSQRNLFEAQIELALKLDKPLMLHIRESYRETLDILSAYPAALAHAHFFAGDWKIAKQFLDRGDTLSFTGVITFARQYDEVIKRLPLDRLLAETDCPFVAPEPYRGQRNEPIYVVEVVKKIAAIRSEDLDKVKMAMIANARRIFNIKDDL